MTANNNDRPALSVTVSTIGRDGIERCALMQLPAVDGVEYVISWQKADDQAIPAALVRDDIRVTTTPSIGLSNNRNNAIARSRGDVILIADDDVDYTETQLRSVIDIFRRHPDI